MWNQLEPTKKSEITMKPSKTTIKPPKTIWNNLKSP